MSETPREVLEALLEDMLSGEAYTCADADRFYAEAAPAKRAEWLARFDAAAIADLEKSALTATAIEAMKPLLAAWIVEAVAKVRGWVSVEERLPEVGVSVWAWDAAEPPGPACHVATRNEHGDWIEQPAGYYLSRQVTHWRPLPEPPK